MRQINGVNVPGDLLSMFQRNDGNALFIGFLMPRAAAKSIFYHWQTTLPVGNAMKIAHTSVLGAKASTWTDIARIRRSQFIGKNCFAFGWLNFHLKNEKKKQNEIFFALERSCIACLPFE